MALKKILLAAGGGAAIAVAVGLGLYWGGVVPSTWTRDAEATAVEVSGPQPKIVAKERLFDFGLSAAGVEQKHSFEIRNDGDATLYIKEVKISCQCTDGDAAKSELAPGETTTIDITWRPKKKDPFFQQTIKLVTNDPRYPEPKPFILGIKGTVEAVVTFEPEEKWNVGAIAEEQPTVVHGVIHSMALESFKVLEVVTEHPLMSGVATPLDQETLDRLHAKCGYDIQVTLAPGIQVGTFREKVTVKTDIRGGAEIPWFLEGERYGPFRIVPMLGADWSSKHLKLNLGKFPADKGKSAQVKMFVNGLGKGEEFKFLGIESDTPFVSLNISPDGANGERDQKKYTVKFEVPPGSPREARTGAASARIKVKTNHPKAEKIEFRVDFVTL